MNFENFWPKGDLRSSLRANKTYINCQSTHQDSLQSPHIQLTFYKLKNFNVNLDFSALNKRADLKNLLHKTYLNSLISKYSMNFINY